MCLSTLSGPANTKRNAKVLLGTYNRFFMEFCHIVKLQNRGVQLILSHVFQDLGDTLV